ncbi:MAG: hypothetical protein Q8K82_07900 [Gemmatimonadaceae bacterium]|nr:hypothetical protein [Gemmatimonadaceae bacterium]
MAPGIVRPEATLAEILSERARDAAPSRLLLDVVGGAVVVALAMWARPFGWTVLVGAGLCFSLYGIWATADRRLCSSAIPTPVAAARAWRVTRASAAVLGMSAFVALLLAALGLSLGTWIS